jgi:outer membrane beta-barrel protein
MHLRRCAPVVLLLALTSSAVAQSRPSQTEPPAPPCLAPSANRLGVQKKTFLRKHRVEIVAQGGLYAADLLSSSYAVGGMIGFFFTEHIGVELSVTVTPVALDVDDSVAGFTGEPRFEAGTGTLALGRVVWSPVHFKVRTAGGGVKHGDLGLVLGAGRLLHETAQGLAFQGGAVLELYLNRWISLRVDLADVILIQEAVGETRVTHNITALAGLGIWVPFGF